MKWPRRFLVRGVFWRHLLRSAVLNVPYWLEPVILAFWALLFLLWGPGRRGVMKNLSAILPGSSALMNFFRVYRVMWNFAWTIDDNVRFKELHVVPDWEFVGREHFDRLVNEPGGAIILTAHMGSYDLGAHLFAQTSNRRIVMVRAPEIDPETHRFEETHAGRTPLQIDFSSRASDLAIDLLHALQRGEIIAVQGDRVTPGISSLRTTFFGKPTALPSGPFALSMAARVPIYPLFIARLGRRRYRLVVGEPFDVRRTRDRAEAFDAAMSRWTRELESVVRDAWFQWYTFEPFGEERAA
ncbi:MAG TPA: lysophospholipid acyltransferase family protein [Thermoanaerobaculia bacterium]|nr:lysophospholipid acyltransferase family protein [Thermoanaerobaculia bacterium]